MKAIVAENVTRRRAYRVFFFYRVIFFFIRWGVGERGLPRIRRRAVAAKAAQNCLV